MKVQRMIFYAAGLVILALGITLNTKTGLGVSPIISVSYSISYVWNLNFGNTTLGLYGTFVAAELLLNHKKPKPARLVFVALQFPLSIAFTRLLNLFSAILPEGPKIFWQQLLLLLAAVGLTGIGIAMSVNMRLIPNPGDGIVQCLSDCTQKEMGLVKNLFDLFNIGMTMAIGFASGHPFVGIGLGTIGAMIGVGRVIAVFNHFFQSPMIAAAGIEK